jgi:tRNA (guanine-N7-)-methyltransferase
VACPHARREDLIRGLCTRLPVNPAFSQPDDPATLARVRAATLFEPPDYFRRLTKRELFPDDPDAPLEVDLGCGDGGFLVTLAAHHPDRRFLGIERLLGRATKAARRAARRSLTNLKVLRIESSYSVSYLLPEAGISRIHLLFPDPWPKKKHLKNRLVRPAFCAAAHRVVEPGGEWLFKTDDADYFAEAVETIRSGGYFEQIPWADGGFPYPPTDFEQQWLGAGKTIHRARFRRRDRGAGGEG